MAGDFDVCTSCKKWLRPGADCAECDEKEAVEIADQAMDKWPVEVQGVLRTAIRDDIVLPAVRAALQRVKVKK